MRLKGIEAQQCAARRHRALSKEQDAAPVDGVRDRTPDQGAPEHGDDLRESHETYVERRAGQPEHLVRQCDDRQLRPEDAHDVPAPQATELAVPLERTNVDEETRPTHRREPTEPCGRNRQRDC